MSHFLHKYDGSVNWYAENVATLTHYTYHNYNERELSLFYLNQIILKLDKHSRFSEKLA